MHMHSWPCKTLFQFKSEVDRLALLYSEREGLRGIHLEATTTPSFATFECAAQCCQDVIPWCRCTELQSQGFVMTAPLIKQGKNRCRHEKEKVFKPLLLDVVDPEAFRGDNNSPYRLRSYLNESTTLWRGGVSVLRVRKERLLIIKKSTGVSLFDSWSVRSGLVVCHLCVRGCTLQTIVFPLDLPQLE